MKEQVQIFLESSQQFLNEIAIALPKIIGALLILLIGWIIARLIKRAIVKLLQLVKLNTLAEKVGIEKFLKEGGLKQTSVDLLGSLFYWIIMLRSFLLYSIPCSSQVPRNCSIALFCLSRISLLL